jgi:hypothetical protein
MRSLFRFPIVALVGAILAIEAPPVATVAHAQGVPGVSPNKCLAGKTKCVTKKAQGLLKCREKCQGSPSSCGATQTECEARVREKFEGSDPSNACFEKLEVQSGTGDPAKDCTTLDDLADIEGRVDAFVSTTMAVLEGGPAGTCAVSVASGQTTCWDATGVVVPCAGTGQDGAVQAGVPLAYVDNGDGTITDVNLGLMWEKKSDDGSINDMDVTYTWDDAFAVHLATLNAGAGFAGHTDWRLPNVRELGSLVNFENIAPAIPPAFNTGCAPGCTVLTCSCTFVSSYRTATTYPPATTATYVVGFYGGHVGYNFKNLGNYVRAVRSL